MWSSAHSWLHANRALWEAFGITFQAVFMARFLVQWIASERQKKSVIPISFWYLSLIGSTGLLIYAVGIGSVAVMLGQMFGTVVYVRNLMLVQRGRRNEQTPPLDPRPPCEA
jgi:lipid-A-disaccharide synthase-like uncharacterized protein